MVKFILRLFGIHLLVSEWTELHFLEIIWNLFPKIKTSPYIDHKDHKDICSNILLPKYYLKIITFKDFQHLNAYLTILSFLNLMYLHNIDSRKCCLSCVVTKKCMCEDFTRSGRSQWETCKVTSFPYNLIPFVLCLIYCGVCYICCKCKLFQNGTQS